MSQNSSLLDTWQQVVNELVELSHQENSGIPRLSQTQQAYLKLTQPVALFDGYAVLSTPHPLAKKSIEGELGEAITRILSHRMGRPVTLAVSVVPGEDETTQNTVQNSATLPTDVQQDSSNHTPVESENLENQGWRPTYSAPTGHQPAKEADFITPTLHTPQVAEDEAFPHNTFSQRSAHSLTTPQPSLGNRIPRETPAKSPGKKISLNPRYTFDNFVIGQSNRFASAAAVAVAESPAKAFNPLFISGGSGLGKTHLLHSVGNYAQELQPELRIKYVSSEEFTNDYINSVRDDRQESFKRVYRNLDILMVDDIQFLAGKEGTQEEFFHTFNALHQAEKQIILSSDRPPRQLTTLEDRLRTRFEGGLITDIQPPDLETRIAILMKKAAADGTRVNRDVLELIASRFESSIRELEGALIRVSAYSSLIDEPIDKEMAIVALRDILPEPEDVEITAPVILDVTADYFEISVDTLTGAGKTRAVAHARQLAMYLCRELTDLSLPKIGEVFGGKDHTTVMYADRKIRTEMTQKRDTYDEIQQLTQLIKSRGRNSLPKF